MFLMLSLKPFFPRLVFSQSSAEQFSVDVSFQIDPSDNMLYYSSTTLL